MLLPRCLFPSTSSPLKISTLPPLLPSRRYLSSSELPEVPEPVVLPFELAERKEGRRTDEALVIAHGLFGSKQNWRSLIKTFAQELGMHVYALVRILPSKGALVVERETSSSPLLLLPPRRDGRRARFDLITRDLPSSHAHRIP
ncbi:hypothetical protein BDY24DRAFT_373070 [Mrakia frigida]|uniref:uncharacterized protein n=1 Tax=Mrakia frigida TaxID=29902 RepID=UPI003FCC17A6